MLELKQIFAISILVTKRRSGSPPGAQPLNPRSYALDLSTFLLVLAVYSLLKLLTGFAKAAFMAWKLMVIKVMTMAIEADKINTTGPMVIR